MSLYSACLRTMYDEQQGLRAGQEEGAGGADEVFGGSLVRGGRPGEGMAAFSQARAGRALRAAVSQLRHSRLTSTPRTCTLERREGGVSHLPSGSNGIEQVQTAE